MHISHRIGNFVVKTDRLAGNQHDSYLTLVTRGDGASFYEARIAYSQESASMNHNDMVTLAKENDERLTAEEENFRTTFSDDMERILRSVRNRNS